ncbi:ATP-binding protein [Anaerolineales bacterium HSG24]|nr:ATP-binding protein [Anaerolineales bacterium HSG24]
MNLIYRSRFVNRETELKFITSKLIALPTSRRNFDFILTVSGVAGIGKTSLLKRVEQEAQAKNIPVIWITFDAPEAKQDNLLYLFQQLIQTISNPTIQSAWQEYESSRGVVEEAFPFVRDRLIQTLVDELVDRPMVWQFDDTHLMSTEVREVVEDILTHIGNDHRLFLIMAGRDTVRWNSFELRRRTRSFPLASLPKDAAQQLAPDALYAPITDQMYDLTRGYPKASVMAYEWIANNLATKTANLSQALKSHESELILALFDDLFEQYILGDIPDRAKTSQLLRYISPLRRFDDHLLSNLLPALNKELFAELSILEARSLTRQVAIQTYLIKWHSGRMAYILEPPVRQLLYLDLKYRDNRKLQQIHEFMRNWYKQAIDETLQKDASSPQSVVYFLEYLYHYMELERLTGRSVETINQAIRQKIDQQFTHYQLRERNHFLEELKRDTIILEILADDRTLIDHVTRIVE